MGILILPGLLLQFKTMYRKWLLLAGVMDLFILSILDKIAYQYYLYWRYPQFDILMHLVGGIAIGLVSAYVYWLWHREKEPEKTRSEIAVVSWRLFFLLNFGFILTIGLGWEVFELFVDRIVAFSPLNILRDLFFGIIGSLSVGLFVLWIHNHKLKKLK